MKELARILLATTAMFVVSCGSVLAYEIQDLTNVENKNDFVLGPDKIEAFLDPGGNYKTEIMVTNRLGKEMSFKVQLEDFKGSRDPEETTILLGEEKGPYSLKDYIKPEVTEFTLKHGQRMMLPVMISIPQDAEPGGLYGVILVSTNPPKTIGETQKDQATGKMNFISRLGALAFVRVKGDVKEDGRLVEIKAGKQNQKLYEQSPTMFSLYYENNGNVAVNPYGILEIKNIFGKKIDEVEVKPFFAMPDSLRLREVKWAKEMLFGRYTVTAQINRGYEDIIDTKSVTIWVIPWKIVTAGFLGLVLVVWFLKWILSHFEFRRKSSPQI